MSEQPSTRHSNWKEIWNNYRERVGKIDELEKRIHESVRRKRRRLANILEERKPYRSSRARLFVTHSCCALNTSVSTVQDIGINDSQHGTSNGSLQWKLLIEGGLLVGHLDHKSATKIEQEAAKNAGVDPDLIESAAVASVTSAADNSSGGYGNIDEVQLDPNLMIRSTDRTEYRGISEKEGDVPIDPIHFTHLFDKVEISLQTIYMPKPNISDASISAGSSRSGSPHPSLTSKKTSSRKNKRNASSIGIEQQQHAAIAVLDEKQRKLLTRSSTKRSLVWNRTDSSDAHAFLVDYVTPGPPPDKAVHSVVAKISLYPRTAASSASSASAGALPAPKHEVRYIISPTLASAFFPDHVKINDKKRKEEDVAISSSKKKKSSLSSKKRKNKADDIDVSSAATKDSVVAERLTPDQKQQSHIDFGGGLETLENDNGPIPVENDILVLPTLSMDEIVSAIYLYIETNQLLASQQDSDNENSFIIKCDSVLKELFNRDQISLSEIQQLLFDNELIYSENMSPARPILLTYIMKENESSTSVEAFSDKSRNRNSATDTNAGITNFSDVENGTTERNKDGNQQQHHSILSLDVDVNVPGLFHYRTRELMRRIKRREFEYTSSRTKARNKVATHASEDIVKARIEEVVSGHGFANEYIPIWLALAKSAPSGSEARASAFIDARTCFLLDRLDHHCRAVKVAHDVANALEMKK